MEILSSLLHALGVNSTLWVQLVCFMICYFAFTELVFKPYLRAFHERERMTIGNEETAVRIVEEAHALAHEYENKARAMNNEIKDVYDKHRTEAQAEYERMMRDARERSTGLIADARTRIASEVQAAHRSLSAEIPAVSATIASQLAGKDLSL